MTVFCPDDLSAALCKAAGGDASGEDQCDIALFPPGHLPARAISCRTALIPGNLKPDRRGMLKTASAVSYGPARRDSVTLSSLRDGVAVISVQRELPLPDGGIFEPQDLVLRGVLPDAERLLFSVGALLVMGMPPERVSAFWC